MNCWNCFKVSTLLYLMFLHTPTKHRQYWAYSNTNAVEGCSLLPMLEITIRCWYYLSSSIRKTEWRNIGGNVQFIFVSKGDIIAWHWQPSMTRKEVKLFFILYEIKQFVNGLFQLSVVQVLVQSTLLKVVQWTVFSVYSTSVVYSNLLII